MDNNNIIIATLALIFLLTATVSPIIKNEFGDDAIYSDTSTLDNDNIEQFDITDSNVIQFLTALIGWIIGAPLWLNLFYTILRVVFWIVVYDKIRGI